MNPVQQSLTLVNRREPVFSKGNSNQVFSYTSFSKDEKFSSMFFEESLVFSYTSFSKDEKFSSKFFEESFSCVPNYNYFSPSDIPSTNENNKFKTFKQATGTMIPLVYVGSCNSDLIGFTYKMKKIKAEVDTT